MDKKNSENLIAYCGLYCGECFAHKGTIADLARDLRKELRQTRFDIMADAMSEISFFEVFKGYQTCYDVNFPVNILVISHGDNALPCNIIHHIRIVQ